MSEIKFNKLRQQELSPDDLQTYMQKIQDQIHFSMDDKIRIEAFLPDLITQINNRDVPDKIKLPSGEKVKSASRITVLKCQTLCLARRSFGKNYINNHKYYEELAKDLLFFVMRHHVNTKSPIGEFCCPTCTLSLLPLYSSNAFKWVDCLEMKNNVLNSLKKKDSIFEGNFHQDYAKWIIQLIGA